ncbi:hypothetical protein TH63_07165 [Rufibacter radiotolerans]|uniref:Uncharacterized protein n=1 Tax=Rufibacter radiotolerans TaxID=1379910 RepID=A0A0H4VI91_9BACT|nr:hypothetical protein [Rufibacter radiotolerans]AKQ45470.1 hypothetical protein TH63_07165 [Rufibacter radiotolerans]
MEKCDFILSALLAKVGSYREPEDHPTLSKDIAADLDLPLVDVLDLSQNLAEEGLVKISLLYNPPLLYLTYAGLSRARRLALALYTLCFGVYEVFPA